MQEASPPASTLLCHPLTPAHAVRTLVASAARTACGDLVFHYALHGDIARLRIAAGAGDAAGATDGLWQHTCFEAFVALAGEAAYREFNFSPAGQWAIYAFSAYRERTEIALPPAPRITTRATPGRLELSAIVPAAALDAASPQRRLELGLTAVVESELAAGALSYWSLRHRAERPDFHRRDSFILELPAAAGALCKDPP